MAAGITGDRAAGWRGVMMAGMGVVVIAGAGAVGRRVRGAGVDSGWRTAERPGAVSASGRFVRWEREGERLFFADEFCFHELVADGAGAVGFVDDDLHGIGVDLDVFDCHGAGFAFGGHGGGFEERVAVVLGPTAVGDAAFGVDGHVFGFGGAWFEGDHAFGLAFTGGEGDGEDIFFDAPFVGEGGFAAGGFPFADHP